jgi:hypothetical protein
MITAPGGQNVTPIVFVGDIEGLREYNAIYQSSWLNGKMTP